MTFAQEEEVFPSLPSTTGELQLPEKDTNATTVMEKPKEENEETNTDKKRKSSEKPTEKKAIFCLILLSCFKCWNIWMS
jgi:hypothetical protein